MALLIKTHLDLAKSSLRQRKGRTFLTCLGIAIGVASIVLILSLMGSVTDLIKEQVTAVGDNLIVVRPESNKDSVESVVSELANGSRYNKSNLSLADVETIKALNPGGQSTAEYPIESVAPISIGTYTINGEKTVDSASVLGTTPELQDIADLTLKDGAFLSESGLNTAVIGRTLSLSLFGTTEPIGKTFNLLGQRFIVVGILEAADDPINYNSVDFDSTIIVNVNQLYKIDPSIQIQQIDIKVASAEAVEHTAAQISDTLVATKNGDKNFTVIYGEQISHPTSNLFDLVSGMLTLVAGISLVVGGIGVMNIMLVSVAERTHEIGIRKSVGATNGNIFGEFLFESLILCLIGGIAGLALGYVLAFFISIITPFKPYADWGIILSALWVPTIVGTLFGLYPAIKAARKNPIDSLKYYN